MTSDMISLSRSTLTDSFKNVRLELLAKEITKAIHFRVIALNSASIVELECAKMETKSMSAWKGKELAKYEQRKNYALFLENNLCGWREVYDLLLHKVSTDGRIISLVCQCQPTRLEDHGCDSTGVNQVP